MQKRSLLIIGVVWLGLLVSGFAYLGVEEYGAAPYAFTGTHFPPKSSLLLSTTEPTLILFAHPQCPCTKATFENLNQLRTETRDRFAITIVFTLPPQVPAGWETGDLWTEAHQMKGIHIFRDYNGMEARRFGVTNSGHVLVYSTAGQLLYSGGITAARGHAGESPGELAIVHLTKGPAPTDRVEKPVFGCSLL